MANYSKLSVEFSKTINQIVRSRVMQQFILFGHGEMLGLLYLARYHDEKVTPNEIDKNGYKNCRSSCYSQYS